MTPPDPKALGRRAQAMIEALADISAEPDRLVRLYLTPEHRRAMDLVAGWMREAGLEVSEDELATLKGRLPGRGNRRLLIGSHMDTVIDAGRFDGTLGVVAGVLAAEHFARQERPLPFGLDVLAFGDEEGSRFPTTLATSSGVAGVFQEAALDSADGAGVTLRDALVRFGKDPSRTREAAYDKGEVLGYVEVHIEQGPVLEQDGLALGVVTCIVGQSRLNVTVRGEAGHAGTVPMDRRRDAFLAGAEMALAAERIALEGAAHGMVGTVGRVEVGPGAVNIIPGSAAFTLDLRAATDPPRLEAVGAFRRGAQRIAQRRGCTVAFDHFHEIGSTPCASWIQEELHGAVADLGQPIRRLVSGAGHDGHAMAHLTEIGMLFVRCRGGISHNPAEFATPEDMGLAVAALIRFVERLAERGEEA
ncbi:MAG: allantoate amidohydrolase [Pseudomonadota bacterium]|nr:allantoate amidohydrolase [Pseudomonadota bacterium]